MNFSILYKLSMLTLFLTALFLGYILYLLFFPFTPLEVKRAYILTKQVKSGHAMFYAVEYCKHVEAGSSAYQQLQSVTDNAFTIPFPVVVSVAQAGCRTAKILLTLPNETPPGHYYLRVDASYQVNPLRIVHVIFRTDVFQVIP